MHCTDIHDALRALEHVHSFYFGENAKIYTQTDQMGVEKYTLGPLNHYGETVYIPATIQAVEKFMQE